MTTTAAEFSVFCPGILEVLSIGKGDLKLAVGTDPEDRERAKELIGEMLRKGYTIFVETDDGPMRVMGFIGERMTYIIEGQPDEVDVGHGPTTTAEVVAAAGEDTSAEPAPKPRRGRPKRTEVPVAGSKATAVGRTAGG